MAINYAMPQISSPVVGADGRMSQDWYLFFCALFNSVGGNTPVAPGSVDISQTAESVAFLTNQVDTLEVTAGVTIPAQPKITVNGINYKYVLGQGWIPA